MRSLHTDYRLGHCMSPLQRGLGDQPFLSLFTESTEEGLPFSFSLSVSSEACAPGSQGTSALFLLTPGAHRCAQLVFDVTS